MPTKMRRATQPFALLTAAARRHAHYGRQSNSFSTWPLTTVLADSKAPPSATGVTAPPTAPVTGEHPVADISIASDASVDVVALAGSTPALSDIGLQAANAMAALHDASGLGWGATLVATAIAVRMTSAPLLWMHQLHTARAAAASREISRALSWIRRTPGTLVQRYASWRRLRSIALQSAGTSSLLQYPWYITLHIPLIAATSLGARSLADSCALEWANAGPPWALDLSSADPTAALPAAAAALWLWNAHSVGRAARARRAAATKEKEKTRRSSDALVRALSLRSGEWLSTGAQAFTILLFPYIIHIPAGVALLWIANGILTATQRIALRSSRARKLLALPTAADIEALAREGPPVLKATASAMRNSREQLQYVQRDILTAFSRRSVDASLAADVNRALQRELRSRRISIPLHAEIRRDTDSGRDYLAVILDESATR